MLTAIEKHCAFLHTCRRHYTDTRTATVNLFKSLILTADDDLRDQFGGRTTNQQVRHAVLVLCRHSLSVPT